MLLKSALSLLALLPLILAAPLPAPAPAPAPAPIQDLDNLGSVAGILDPLLSTQDNSLPVGSAFSPNSLSIVSDGNPTSDGLLSGGLLDGILNTVEDITEPLNISLGLNTTVLGVGLDLGLNVELGDDDQLICGPINGIYDNTPYALPCVCWSDERGIVIDVQLGVDIGLGEVDGLEAFLKAQIQFGGHQFAYPAYSVPTCDGDGGFNCPGGRQANGKCSAFLAAKPTPRPSPSPPADPTATPAPVQAAEVPSATDLSINLAPPSTLGSVPTTTPVISTSVGGTTITSPDAGPTFGVQSVGLGPTDDQVVRVNGVTTTTSLSTQTVVLPATVFVEMVTTTQLSTVYATVTQTQTTTSVSTATQTQTQTKTQVQTQTQTQWTTQTISSCSAPTEQDEEIKVNSIPQPANTAGYTSPPPSSSPSASFSDFAVLATPTPTPTATSTSSKTASSTTSPEVVIAATPTPTPSGSAGQPPSTNNGDDDDTFSGPRVIDLAHPQGRPCPEGQKWGTTQCCRADQVEVDGVCQCTAGFENILDVCLSLCIGTRAPSGECLDLGLDLDLGLGLGGLL